MAIKTVYIVKCDRCHECKEYETEHSAMSSLNAIAVNTQPPWVNAAPSRIAIVSPQPEYDDRGERLY